jgi:protein-S-isoprenylcysteine O-methyltransferase Ste14
MFIPLSLNVPLLVGGLVAWFVSNRSKDAALNTARNEKGTLIASGFIAGGALMGVVSAVMKFGGVNLFQKEWAESAGGEWLGLGMYALLIVFFVWYVIKNKPKNF